MADGSGNVRAESFWDVERLRRRPALRPEGRARNRIGSTSRPQVQQARIAAAIASSQMSGSSRLRGPVLMRSEAEVRPHGTVLVCLRRRADLSNAGARPPPTPLPARHTPLELTSVEDHGDLRIAPEALVELPPEFRAIAADHDEPSAQPPPDCPWTLMAMRSTGRGPGGGTRLARVDPSLITFLAIVVMASWKRRDGFLRGRGVCETLPKDVPVPGDAA